MPMHDCTKVAAGVFYAFHHHWISTLADSLNCGGLPADYYALPEQVAAGIGSDVLRFQAQRPETGSSATSSGGVVTADMLQTRLRARFTAAGIGGSGLEF